MNYLIENAGLKEQIICDSAGTSGFHVGEKADSRSRKFAQKRGIELTSLSRQFCAPSDFLNFDFIIAMDDQNLRDILDFDKNGEYSHKISKMTDFCIARNETKVPDPYYSGEQGFDLVLDILEDSCQGLLDKVKEV
jgi:protein-tyrosine phosphatase